MTSVAAGRLNKLMWIQEPQNTRDSMGGVSTTWCDKRQIWCELRPVTARETVSGDRISQDVTHIIRFRYLRGLMVTPSMRIVKKGKDCVDRIFNIQQAINSQEKDVLIEVTAIEDLNVSS